MKVILNVISQQPTISGDRLVKAIPPISQIKKIFEKIFTDDKIWGYINDISINEYGYSIDVTSVNVFK